MSQTKDEQHDKNDVIKKLNSGEYKLVKYIPKPGSKPHEVWNTFRQIAIAQPANEPVVHIPGWIDYRQQSRKRDKI